MYIRTYIAKAAASLQIYVHHEECCVCMCLPMAPSLSLSVLQFVSSFVGSPTSSATSYSQAPSPVSLAERQQWPQFIGCIFVSFQTLGINLISYGRIYSLVQLIMINVWWPIRYCCYGSHVSVNRSSTTKWRRCSTERSDWEALFVAFQPSNRLSKRRKAMLWVPLPFGKEYLFSLPSQHAFSWRTTPTPRRKNTRSILRNTGGRSSSLTATSVSEISLSRGATATTRSSTTLTPTAFPRATRSSKEPVQDGRGLPSPIR